MMMIFLTTVTVLTLGAAALIALTPTKKPVPVKATARKDS